MLLISYIQQYFNTSNTVLTNRVWKLLIALFKVLNTGAFTVACKVQGITLEFLAYITGIIVDTQFPVSREFLQKNRLQALGKPRFGIVDR